MRVTFLAMGWEQLPVSLLSALARRDGHRVGLAFSASLFDDRYFLHLPKVARLVDDRRQVVDAIVAQQPDVLACSALTNSYRWMLSVAREAKLRCPGIRVVFGGVHASAVPERVLARSEVDYVCVGEGDVAFPALLGALERGGPAEPIPNLRWKDPSGRMVAGPQLPYFADLDSLPHFDKRLWEEHLHVADVYLTMASRGCPYRCTFCFNNFFVDLPDAPRGKYVRQRSVAHVLDELSSARRRYGRLELINFQDDVFTVDKAWLSEFLRRFRAEIGSPFRCMSHPRYVDGEVAGWLADAGCVGVQIGVQSIDDDFKRASLKRYEQSSHVERSIDALESRGVSVQVDHMLGIPGEPEDSHRRATAFYAAHLPSRISIYWATYFPGTEMMREAVASGRLSEHDARAIEEGELTGYHDPAVAEDRVRDAALRAHGALFRLLPLVPRRWRTRLRPEWFRRWPAFAVEALGVTAVLCGALRPNGREERAYARHYARSLARWALRRLALPVFDATPAPRWVVA